jgi:hypothetical protein
MVAVIHEAEPSPAEFLPTTRDACDGVPEQESRGMPDPLRAVSEATVVSEEPLNVDRVGTTKTLGGYHRHLRASNV